MGELGRVETDREVQDGCLTGCSSTVVQNGV